HVVKVSGARTTGVDPRKTKQRPLVAVPLDLRLRTQPPQLHVIGPRKPKPVNLLRLETLLVLLRAPGTSTGLRSELNHRPRRNPSLRSPREPVPVSVNKFLFREHDNIEIALIEQRHACSLRDRGPSHPSGS